MHRRGIGPRALAIAVAALALAGVGALTGRSAATAEPWTPGPARFDIRTTNDVPVPMADGRVLRAVLHEPIDPSTGQPAPGPFPVVLWLTPYGKTVANQVNPYLVQRGYLGVSVDVAGTGGSDGASELFGPLEAGDSVQIIDWAAALPRSNGRVGMSGISYLGIVQLFAAAAVGPHSPLRAVFPIAASVDPYRDLFTSGGVVNVESPTGLLAAYAGVRTLTPLAERGPTDPLDAARLVVEHGLQTVPFEGRILLDVLSDGDRRFDGEWWSSRAPGNVLQRIVDNGVAVYLVGGQFDVFQRGEPLLYAGLQNAAAGRTVSAPMLPDQRPDPRYQLLYGPWDHSTQGQGVDLDRIQLQWFDHWLKGLATGITDTTGPLHVIEPGGRAYDTTSYPVAQAPATRLHLSSGGVLRPDLPDGGPADEVPFLGIVSSPCNRSTQQWAAGGISPEVCGARRQPSDPLPGEVAYATDPLLAPMQLAGPIGLTVHARTNARETMWVARLEDVAPDGTAVEITGGALLGSFRAVDPARSWAGGPGGWLLPYHPSTQESLLPVVPHERTRYDIELRPAFVTLAIGHRLRLVIGTSDAPHLLPPAQRVDELFGGTAAIEHDPAVPSFLDLPVRVP